MKKVRLISLKNQYTSLQAFYWASNCVIIAFAAVYLQHKGLSDLMIGIITGGSAFLMMAVQPLVSQLAERVWFLSIKRMIQLLMLFMMGIWGILLLFQPSVIGIEVLYLLLYTLNCCVPALLSAMGMEYINQGKYVNFGLSRGIGSFVYASSAVLLGVVAEQFSPDVLGILYIIMSLLSLIILHGMEDVKGNTDWNAAVNENKKKTGIIHSILGNGEFLGVMLAFFLVNMCNWGTLTYLVNLIRELGGTDTIYGIACFVGSSSELPVMLLFGWMLKKTSCHTLLKISVVGYLLQPIAFLLAGNLPIVILSMLLQAPSYGIFTVASVYYVNEVMGPTERVQGQSVFYMITTGASTGIGNLLSGYLLDVGGIREMLAIYAVISAAAVVVLVAGMHLGGSAFQPYRR